MAGGAAQARGVALEHHPPRGYLRRPGRSMLTSCAPPAVGGEIEQAGPMPSAASHRDDIAGGTLAAMRQERPPGRTAFSISTMTCRRNRPRPSRRRRGCSAWRRRLGAVRHGRRGDEPDGAQFLERKAAGFAAPRPSGCWATAGATPRFGKACSPSLEALERAPIWQNSSLDLVSERLRHATPCFTLAPSLPRECLRAGTGRRSRSCHRAIAGGPRRRRSRHRMRMYGAAWITSRPPAPAFLAARGRSSRSITNSTRCRTSSRTSSPPRHAASLPAQQQASPSGTSQQDWNGSEPSSGAVVLAPK